MHSTNKKGEPYHLLKTFSVLRNGRNMIYHRIRYINTGNEDVITNEQMKTGEFEDVANTEYEVVEAPISEVEEKVKDATDEVTIATEEINVTFVNIKTDEVVKVTSNEELEAFISKYNLMTESVELLLEGKQKTHKKWTIQ